MDGSIREIPVAESVPQFDEAYARRIQLIRGFLSALQKEESQVGEINE